MDRKLLGYLPPVLQEVVDFQAVNGANGPEISLAWDALSKVLANQFLEDADKDGVSRWERELQLCPKDTDTLAVRKARIKAKWNMETPYTLPWLRRWIDSMGGMIRHREILDGYILKLELEYDVATGIGSAEMDAFAADLYAMLMAIRPANILIELSRISVFALEQLRLALAPGFTGDFSVTALPGQTPALGAAAIYAVPYRGACTSILALPEMVPGFGGAYTHTRPCMGGDLCITRLPEFKPEEGRT